MAACGTISKAVTAEDMLQCLGTECSAEQAAIYCLRLARRLGAPSQDVEDLVQQAMLELIMKARQVRHPFAFLRTVLTRSLVRQRARAARLHGAIIPFDAVADTASSTTLAPWRKIALHDSLRGLRMGERSILEATYHRIDKPVSERDGPRSPRERVQVHRLRRRLRADL